MIENGLLVFEEILTQVQWDRMALGLLVLLLGQFLVQGLGHLLNIVLGEAGSRQRRFIFRKAIVYGVNALVLVAALKIWGVDYKLILGAAGVLTVALGFAARSSVSNLMSGLFLIFEKPFVMGDLIQVDGHRGEVLSVDLLSTSLRSVDNLLVRIPNDLVMEKPVMNYSRFPILRMDMRIHVPYDESLSTIHELLNEVAGRNKLSLQEPGTLFQVKSFEENHIEVVYSVWAPRESFAAFKGEFYKEVHLAFRKAGVSQPQASVLMTHSRPSPADGA